MNRSHSSLLTIALGSALALTTINTAGAVTVSDTTLAGWTFSQFLGEGYPSVDGSTGDATDFIVATFRGSATPVNAVVDGNLVGQSGGTGYTDPSIGVWSFSNFNTTQAVEVRADTLGALNTINAVTLDGKNMSSTDTGGMMLTFNLKNALWDISVSGTGAFENASASDFTYAARGNGGAATLEWLFNGEVFSTATIAANSFATYAAELPSEFYGVGTIQGRLTSGSIGTVSFDNVQINGTPSAVPEPSSFAALAGLAGLALVGSRRRRA